MLASPSHLCRSSSASCSRKRNKASRAQAGNPATMPWQALRTADPNQCWDHLGSAPNDSPNFSACSDALHLENANQEHPLMSGAKPQIGPGCINTASAPVCLALKPKARWTILCCLRRMCLTKQLWGNGAGRLAARMATAPPTTVPCLPCFEACWALLTGSH